MEESGGDDCEDCGLLRLEPRGEADLSLTARQPSDSLAEDYPHIALYLRSLVDPTTPFDPNGFTSSSASAPPDLEAPTDELLLRVRDIMEASERGELSSAETDDRLRAVVEQVVNGQVEVGRAIGEGMDYDPDGGVVREREEGGEDESMAKRPREEAGR